MWKNVYLVLKLFIRRAGVRDLVGGGKTIKKLCPVLEHDERAIVHIALYRFEWQRAGPYPAETPGISSSSRRDIPH
jgi:hypothetical protein